MAIPKMMAPKVPSPRVPKIGAGHMAVPRAPGNAGRIFPTPESPKLPGPALKKALITHLKAIK
jgi:hypothetical protein